MKRTVYMDYAAATPLDPKVIAVMQPYLAEKFYNPSALYLASQQVSKDITTAREIVAVQLGAKPVEIIFTAGGTEANNVAIYGVMSQFPEANMVTSSIEHDSVLLPSRQYQTKEAAVRADGRLDLADLEAKIDDKTVLVSIMYANNEIGTIQPLRSITKLIDKIRINRQATKNKLPLYFHTDACQASNYLDLHVHRLGVDLMTLNGGKIYGPKQVGVLYKSSKVVLRPLILGGGQENGLRSGTENVAGIVGFAKALEIAQFSRENEAHRQQELSQKFITLIEEKIPGALLNGSREYRLPNNVHVTFPGLDNERLLMELDEAGVQCAAGSACSASKEEASHVLLALGLTEAEARSSVRFTIGKNTKQDDIQFAAQNLQKIVT